MRFEFQTEADIQAAVEAADFDHRPQTVETEYLRAMLFIAALKVPRYRRWWALRTAMGAGATRAQMSLL